MSPRHLGRAPPGSPRRLITWRTLTPILLAAVLVQFSVPIARIATTYWSFDAGLSDFQIGCVSASFAVLPALLAVPVGRYYDRNGTTRPLVVGSVLIFAACLLLLTDAADVATVIACTAVLGMGHMLMLSSLQFAVTRVSSAHHRDSVLGYHLLALGIGLAIGPLAIATVANGGWSLSSGLLVVSLTGSIALMGSAATIALLSRRPKMQTSPQLPLLDVIKVPRLGALVLLGSLAISAQDLLLIFLPLLGVERGMSPVAIGLMLSLQSSTSIAARTLFAWLLRRFGRRTIMVASTALTAAIYGLLAAPLSAPTMFAAIAIVGFTQALSIISAIALTVQIAPPRSRGTALSFRYLVNRSSQVIILTSAGAAASVVGISGLFAASGLALMASAVWLVLIFARYDENKGKP